MKKEILIVLLLIIATTILRVVNADLHIYNFIPMSAIGLFSGSILQNKKWAFIIPLLAMLLSDIGLQLFTKTPGFYGVSQIVTYVALIMVTLLGTTLVKRSTLNIVGYTLSGSMIFFLVSNFGTFLSGYYGYSFQGLVNCYTMAIPFYKTEMATNFFVNTFKSDMLFSLVAFGIYYVASYKKLVAKTV